MAGQPYLDMATFRIRSEAWDLSESMGPPYHVAPENGAQCTYLSVAKARPAAQQGEL